MADQSIPRRNQAYVLRTTLVSQADANVMQDPPTVGAGDCKRSIDGANLANTTNAPALTNVGEKIAEVELTATEMDCDILVVCWADAAGAQWQDQTWIIYPTDSTLAVIYAYIVAAYATITATLASIVASIAALPGAIINLLLAYSPVKKAVRSLDLYLYRGDTWSQQISGMGDLTGYTDIWFGIKEDPDDTDDQARVLISTSVGLERINGAAATVPANGSITIVDLVNGIIQVDLDEVETAKLVPDRRYWDAQWLIGGDVETPRAGRISIDADIVRATS